MKTSTSKSSEGHPSVSDDNEKAMQPHLLNLHDFLHEKLFVKVDQIVIGVHLSETLVKRTAVRWLSLFKSTMPPMRARGMLTEYISSTISPKGATYVAVVHSDDDIRLLEDTLCIVMLLGYHQRRFVEILRGKDGFEWAVEQLLSR